MKLPLVRARGQWIVLRPEDIEAALSFLARMPGAGRGTRPELVRSGSRWIATSSRHRARSSARAGLRSCWVPPATASS